ncbi:MAG: hypothetical protein A2V70_14420 [Planctomycetes bacterium RBG_13_63_9]|nr:MAG: hypothetical protein A2V70_14420 [Planctomycetes bacterium RBG_13_63_9]
MKGRTTMLSRVIAAVWVAGVPLALALGGQIAPDAFQNPAVFDFTDLAVGTHLGSGLPNPYASRGVEFTGYVTDYTYGDLHGNHLATGFANSPPEPFVVRLSLLDQPALRVGAYVWPEYGSRTAMTAYDDLGHLIESFTSTASSGTVFMGLEAPPYSPIRRVEWRGLPGSTLTTFPRVDGVMVQSIPEPGTFVLLAIGLTCLLFLFGRRSAFLAAVIWLLGAPQAHAEVWFLGIGNDGYYTDVSGLRTAYQAMPNPHGTGLHFQTYSNHGGSVMISDINWLATNARPGDLAIFYYSGHGGQASDFGGEELNGWAMNSYDETIGRTGDWRTDDQLSAAFAKIDSRVPIVTLFDSCYSGGMVGGLKDLNSLTNVFAMLSSRENEVSYGGSPYSRFTSKLITGISGSRPADVNHDGLVTFGEWFSYTRNNVSGQTPVYFDAAHYSSLSIMPIPEPATLALLVAGAVTLLVLHSRWRFVGRSTE